MLFFCLADIQPPEPPIIEIPSPISGVENFPVRFSISATVPGDTNNENLTVLVSNVPVGSRFSGGTLRDNQWLFIPQDFGEVELILPQDTLGIFILDVVATAAGASRQRSVILNIQPVADRPAISVAMPVCYNSSSQRICIPITVASQADNIGNYTIILSELPNNVTAISYIQINRSSSGEYHINAAHVSESIEAQYHGDFEAFTFYVMLLSEETFDIVRNISIDVDVCIGAVTAGKSGITM